VIPTTARPNPATTAGAYLLHHLAPEEVRVFEDHYMTCGRCAGIVEEREKFIAAMKRTADRLRGGAGG
jgi:hypothetical protein